MATQNADKVSPPPAVWERLLGALAWALQVYIWSFYINIWAGPAGLVLFLLLRKRRPFLARLGGWLAIWCLVLNAGYLVITVSGLLKGMDGEKMGMLLSNNLPTLVKSPGLIPQYWSAYDPQAKAIIALLLGALALNILVSLSGIIIALFSGRPRQPQAESAPLPEAV